MDSTNPATTPDIQAILGEMATLTSMERGSLNEEYRSGSRADGGDPVRLGPYYKHQAWEGGRNVSRRVPPEQVPALKDDLANYERFTELATAFAEKAIALTRQRRGRITGQEDSSAAKKNSAKKRGANAIRKPKPSSRKPKPG
jgi:hypothetical protein